MHQRIVEEKRPRSEWIDLARGICMILVVFCHTYSWAGIRYYVYMFHLPVFFVTAGYCYRQRTFKEELRRSADSLIRPFLWTSIFITVGCVALDGENPVHIAASMLLCFSFDRYNFFSSAGAVWFLGCLFCTRIIFHMIIKNKRNTLLVIIFSAMTALAGEMTSRLIYLPYSFDVAMVAQFLMLFGYFYHENEDKADRLLGKGTAFIIMGVIVIIFGLLEHSLAGVYFNLAGRSYPFHLLSVVFNAAVSITLLQLCKRFLLWDRFPGIVKGITYIGRNSLLVLCVHSIEDRWLSRFRTGTLADIALFCVKLPAIILTVTAIRYLRDKIYIDWKIRGG